MWWGTIIIGKYYCYQYFSSDGFFSWVKANMCAVAELPSVDV